MGDWAQSIGETLQTHRAWAGPLLALITFGDSLVVVGAFLPATAVMLIVGGLAAAGSLDLVEVTIWCLIGATGGDAVSYAPGRRIGPKARQSAWLSGHKRTLARARLFFQKFGSASIYLCRFMGPVRAFVPLAAGMSRMPSTRFQIANLGSAAIWVPVMLAPGYLAGDLLAGAYHRLKATELAVIALVECLLLILALRLGRPARSR